MRRDYKRPNCVKHDEKKTDVHWKAGFRNVIMRKRRDWYMFLTALNLNVQMFENQSKASYYVNFIA